ncbi:olfactory receptor 52K2-like [Hypomesus transpacificus]|uniref:olfactory receptor 52K2-like n=1 Tax=Hypomesus transpacificus TaxID=137520 RepID=UPI001F0739CF|nr:olfactory receptor 52K2-like [Hypomesus transpacificus]
MNLTFLLTAYGPPGPLNKGAFVLPFLLFSFTIFSNLLLMFVIYVDSTLHKPMYILLFNLAVNGLVGCTSVCPKVMENLIKVVPDITHEGCLLQVFFIYSHATSAYAILTAMAYDRYVSICKPLQYYSIMTPFKVKLLLVIVNVIPIILLAIQVFITSSLPLCGYIINKLFYDNLAIVSLSCVQSAASNLFGILLTLILVVLPLVLVVLSYIRILIVCLKASKDSQKKAFSTCAPHLITFINFSAAILFSVIYNRYSVVSREVNIIIAAAFILFPPLLNPLIYGIRTKEIKTAIRKILRGRVFGLSNDVAHLKPKPVIVSNST